MHVIAIMKVPKAYEHMNPELEVNELRVLISDLAGKSNVEYKAKEAKNTFDKKHGVADAVKKRMEKRKALEAKQ